MTGPITTTLAPVNQRHRNDYLASMLELDLTIAQLVGPVQTTVLVQRYGKIPTRSRQLWDDLYNQSRELLADREVRMEVVLATAELKVRLSSFKIYEAEGHLVRVADMPNDALAARSVGFSGQTLASKGRDYRVMAVAYWMACQVFRTPPRGAFTIYHGYDRDLTVGSALWVAESLPRREEIETYVLERVRLLGQAFHHPNDTLPACTEEETWSTAKRPMARCYTHCPAAHACAQFRRFQEERLKLLGQRSARTMEKH